MESNLSHLKFIPSPLQLSRAISHLLWSCPSSSSSCGDTEAVLGPPPMGSPAALVCLRWWVLLPAPRLPQLRWWIWWRAGPLRWTRGGGWWWWHRILLGCSKEGRPVPGPSGPRWGLLTLCQETPRWQRRRRDPDHQRPHSPFPLIGALRQLSKNLWQSPPALHPWRYHLQLPSSDSGPLWLPRRCPQVSIRSMREPLLWVEGGGCWALFYSLLLSFYSLLSSPSLLLNVACIVTME